VIAIRRTAPSVYDDAWNIRHRAEAPLQRADRNFTELLQELRVAQTGVQILFAFLLTLSFMDRFAAIDTFQRAVYVSTLVASATTVALLVAPVAAHRLMFQCGRKRELVRVTHRMAVLGLVSLAVTMLAGMLLVLDVVVGRVAALTVVAALAVVFGTLWAGVPLRVLRGPVLPRSARSRPGRQKVPSRQKVPGRRPSSPMSAGSRTPSTVAAVRRSAVPLSVSSRRRMTPSRSAHGQISSRGTPRARMVAAATSPPATS